MKRLLLSLTLVCCISFLSTAQQVIPLYEGQIPGNNNTSVEEKVTYTESGEIAMISNVTEPSITIYLPEPEKATGTAVVLCPGGGMRVLGWANDVLKMAKFLNERGIAAIGLKYRLYTEDMRPPQMQNPPAKGGMPFSYSVVEFDKYEKANANPMPVKEMNEGIYRAADDVEQAIKIVREHADEWNIDPDKVGTLGFSAGGGVSLAAAIRSQDSTSMPSFMASVFGPSLIDVEVPVNAPPLFICSNIEHNNVAAGCLALFLEWKKAGIPAELHLYDVGKGPFGLDPQGQTSDGWSESFITWLKVRGF